MDDAFLHDLRRDPPPAFADRLRARLRAQEIEPVSAAPRWWTAAPVKWAAASVVVAVLFSVPAVRTSAQAFLSLFRVQNFVAVPVNLERIAALEQGDLDLPRLLGSQVMVLVEPGPPLVLPTIETAAAAADIRVAAPSWLPANTARTEIRVEGERALRVIADTNIMEAVLQTLGIDDVRVPHEINGQSVTVSVPAIVAQEFQVQQPDSAKAARAILRQVRTPEVMLPAGLNLAALGEIGLRVLGFDAAQARRFAGQIDWNTTLVVPLPPAVRDFQRITVRGADALALEGQETERGTQRMILWSTGDRVFVLQGTYQWENMLRMAESIE